MLNPLSWFGPLLQIISTIEDPTAPTVTLDNVVVTGKTLDNVDSFLGIPFANAPRFGLPEPITYTEDIDATKYASSCVQHNLTVTATAAMLEFMENKDITLPVPEDQDESCLSINVIRPSTATETSNLPVVVWFYGGGFLIGDSETWDEMGNALVRKSVTAQEDTIYVSFNYRLSAYGFLGGDEVQAAGVGNLGLRDQREALKWVQQYISAFGGNPNKVILWGQSAGAISASLQMLAYNGSHENLFHGVFLQSGAPLPLGNISRGQDAFESLAAAVGCTGSAKLECMRQVPFAELKAAVDATDGVFSESALLLSWRPSADGSFLLGNPQNLVQEGKVADVHVVAGNMDDEGTLFSIGKIGSIKTDAQFTEWIKSSWIPDATDAEKANVTDHQYINDVSKGSPFGTNTLNQYNSNTQYKRIAAFQGDMVFQAPRRFFVKELAGQTERQSHIWVYLRRGAKLPIIGSVHGGDVGENVANHNLLTDYVIKFANNLDPNLGTAGVLAWPKYTQAAPKSYLFPVIVLGFPAPKPKVEDDDHRDIPFSVLSEMGLKYPI
ncbi:alpha/beta-hydrolase [Pholiota conissans]|uniref:Carboxylic ester hydrolase n=1 Tax=Pholiota conissans TaxID=109636 RepID=A0A9P5Z9R9_9AGAR|nr:alpha/beta-hydrolase [Pholiota conissans]